MPRLSELLLLEHSRLLAFSAHIEDALRAEFDHEQQRLPVYTIKSRIKTFDQIENKLRKKRKHFKAERNTSSLERLDRLLHEEISSFDELSRYVGDVVGLRIVWYFERAKQEAAIKLINRNACQWIEPVSKTPNDRAIEAFADAKKTLDKQLQKYHLPPKSELLPYTAIHITCRLTPRDRLYTEFDGLTCEIQLRTLLEEAWAECSHYLTYKGISERNIDKNRRSELEEATGSVKKILVPLDDKLEKLNRQSNLFKAHRLHPMLQLSQHYPINSRGEIGNRIIDAHEQAYLHRVSGEYDDSVTVLENAVKRLLDICVPEHAKTRIRRRLLCDIAASYIHLRKLDQAEKAVRAALKLEKKSFWATLRSAELCRRRFDFSSSVKYCDMALRRVDQVQWCSTAGLASDVLCYKAWVYWSQAANAFARSRESDGIRSLKKALCDCDKVISDMSGSARVRDITYRALSLKILLQSYDDHRKISEEQLDEILQFGARCSANDMGRVAWARILLTRNFSTDKSKRDSTLHLCAQAEGLANQSSRFKLVRRIRAMSDFISSGACADMPAWRLWFTKLEVSDES